MHHHLQVRHRRPCQCQLTIVVVAVQAHLMRPRDHVAPPLAPDPGVTMDLHRAILPAHLCAGGEVVV